MKALAPDAWRALVVVLQRIDAGGLVSVTMVIAPMACVVFGGISGPPFPFDTDLGTSGAKIFYVEWLMDVTDEVKKEFHGDFFLS